MAIVTADVSEDRVASNMRMERIMELGTTLTVTSETHVPADGILQTVI
jgi:hypothetical protein